MIKKLFEQYKEIFIYLIFGCLTTLVSLFSYSVFIYIFKINYQISNVISWIFAVIFAYITNKKYVFNSTNDVKKEFIKFITLRIFSLLVEMFVLYILIDLLKVNELFAKLVSQGIITIINYLFSKIFIFKSHNLTK